MTGLTPQRAKSWIVWPSTGTTNGTDSWYVDASTTGTIQVYPSTAVTGGNLWTIQTTNGTGTSANIWGQWNENYLRTSKAGAWNAWVAQSNHRIEVRETRAQAEARRLAEEQRLREYRAAEELRKKTTEEAARRARRLLVENISPAQRQTLKDKGYFDVNVKGKTYRIKWGSHGNVYLVHGDREVVSYCIQPPDVPAGDAMLAQKLMLETDEASFLRIANARQLVRA